MTIKLRRPPDLPAKDIEDLPRSLRDYLLDMNRWQIEVWKQLFTDGALDSSLISSTVTVITADTTLTEFMTIVKVTGAYDVALPAASSSSGKRYSIDNAHTATITVSPASGELIEGETTQDIPPDSGMQIYCDGTGWRIV